jgi:hypothetical protein
MLIGYRMVCFDTPSVALKTKAFEARYKSILDEVHPSNPFSVFFNN